MNENPMMKIALYLGGTYLLFNLYALLVSDRLLFVPQIPGYEHLPHQVRIDTADSEQINAVYREHPDARYTILFSHGNQEDLSGVVPFMEQFYDLGYSILMYDYRGYGTSDGTPSTAKAKQDVAAAYRWLVEQKKVPPETIIAYGRSLGGALAIWLAAHHEVGALVAESTFASAFRVKTRWPLLPWDKFNSLRLIARVQCPVLVMHGREDTIIPLWHGEKLFDAATEPKQAFWINGAQHNNYAYVAGEKYLAVFQEFMQTVDHASASTPK